MRKLIAFLLGIIFVLGILVTIEGHAARLWAIKLSDYYSTGGDLQGIHDWIAAVEASEFKLGWQDVEIKTGTAAGFEVVTFADTTDRITIISAADLDLQERHLWFKTVLVKRFRADGIPWYGSITKGSNQLVVPDATDLEVGMLLVITSTEPWETQWGYGKSACAKITAINGTTLTLDKTFLFDFTGDEPNLTVDFTKTIRFNWYGLRLRRTDENTKGTLRIQSAQLKFLWFDIHLPDRNTANQNGIYFSNCFKSIVGNGRIDGGTYPISMHNGYDNVVRNLYYINHCRHPVDSAVAERDYVYDNWTVNGDVDSPAPAHPSYNATVKNLRGTCLGYSPRTVGFTMLNCDIEVTGTETNYWQSLDLVVDDYPTHPMTIRNCRIYYSGQNHSIIPNRNQNATFENCQVSIVGQSYDVNTDRTLTLTNCTVGAFWGYGGATFNNCIIDGDAGLLYDKSLLWAGIAGNGGLDAPITLNGGTVQNHDVIFSYVFSEVTSTGTTFKNCPSFSRNNPPPYEAHIDSVLDNIGSFPHHTSQQFEANFINPTLINGTTPP